MKQFGQILDRPGRREPDGSTPVTPNSHADVESTLAARQLGLRPAWAWLRRRDRPAAGAAGRGLVTSTRLLTENVTESVVAG
jgi:hypothetical protein